MHACEHACVSVILRGKEVKPYKGTQLVRMSLDEVNLISGQLSVKENEYLGVTGSRGVRKCHKLHGMWAGHRVKQAECPS